MKLLIEDLFEVTKVSSGNIEFNMKNIDLNSLLRQAFGEFEDKRKNSNLEFIKNINENKIVIYADGRRVFRAFQNLISNILKYSMDNTRVYIDTIEKENIVQIEFKNISKYILDINEDELLERFKRGDSSRTTEGNGLGLAIAKSLTELQKGQFKIKIDGDLFKVTLTFNKVSKA